MFLPSKTSTFLDEGTPVILLIPLKSSVFVPKSTTLDICNGLFTDLWIELTVKLAWEYVIPLPASVNVGIPTADNVRVSPI